METDIPKAGETKTPKTEISSFEKLFVLGGLIAAFAVPICALLIRYQNGEVVNTISAIGKRFFP